MVPDGMVFLRSNSDHHGVALVGGAGRAERTSLNHFAFEVGSLEDDRHAVLAQPGPCAEDLVEGRRRAGCQIAVEFQDPDGNNLEIYWGLDQIGTGSQARPASEWRRARPWRTPSPTPSPASGCSAQARRLADRRPVPARARDGV